MKITKLAKSEKTQEDLYQVLQHLYAACQTLSMIRHSSNTQWTSEYTAQELEQLNRLNEELTALYTRATNLYNPKHK